MESETTAADSPPLVVKDLNELPLLVTLDEIAAVLRRSRKTIQRELFRGTFNGPAPRLKYPYRWLREDVAEFLRSQAGAPPKPDPIMEKPSVGQHRVRRRRAS